MADKERSMKADQRRVPPNRQDVYRALQEGQFVPFFQPLVNLRTGQLAGFEVLARWQHPVAGLISPDEFISLAEQDGWIDDLTRQILEKALIAAAVVPDPLTLAINVSPVQLRDHDLPEQIRAIASQSGFALSRLVVEVTESAFIDNLQSASTVIADLKALGCKLALDDFGTGYSSLQQLQSLPFDELKVDRSFVSSMTEKRESRKIVSAIVGLGQSLGLIAVAEGIETREQAEMMLWLGCDIGQGYFYGMPVPASELAASVSAHREKLAAGNPSAWKSTSAANMDLSSSQRLAQLQAVYDGAPVGLAFIDQNLRYLNINKKLADMNGATVETHLGSLVSEMIPEFFPTVEPYIRRALAGEAMSDVESAFPTNGQTRLVSYQPALDEGGEVVGIAIAVTDITERKRIETALAVSEGHYRNMVELNPQVLWIMDPQGRNLHVSPRWDKSTGLMKSSSTDQEWLKSVHPEDTRSASESLADSRRSGSTIDIEYRVGNTEEGWRWKRSMGSPRFDNSGNIVCWYGSVQDIDLPSQLRDEVITQQVISLDVASNFPSGEPAAGLSRAEKRQQALLDLEILDTPAEAEYDDLVALASEVCAVPISLVSLVDSERQWFKASLGLAACETPISDSFCAHAIEQPGLFIVEDATLDERFKANPLVLGDPHIRFYAGMPLYADKEIAVGTLCVIDTVPRSLSPGQTKALAILSHQVQARMELRSERRKLLAAIAANHELSNDLEKSNQFLKRTNVQLELLASTDSLTGMLNRRAFQDRMDAEFSTAVRQGRTLSLLVMDIDDFKKRNDQLGHAVGDEALCRVGEVLRRVLREADTAARIGGEEFAIILPETSPGQAAVLVKRIQDLLGTGSAGFPRVTLSIGIACLGTDTDCWETLLSQADLAMYDAKRAGKNRCAVYQSRNVA